ncbi:MAG: pantoate--beta-alanine ligase [Mariprofundaceae bacterium]|nr:pantoate--beta-alanine ligase [Mariprofundaceae bacterium]
MKSIRSTQQVRQYLAPFREERIALVPTMGCLHAGHISLIRKAKRLADIVVVSIYVNPRQFGEHEDFSQYPKTFEKDEELCRKEGVHCIFHPEKLYADDGPKITSKVAHMDQMLCGVSRSGHFDGVATVVNILFNIIQPNIAIFGEKDWQQLAIIRRMAYDLHMPIEIIGSGIVREHDGLAMSSRNRYLNACEREKASMLYASLKRIQQLAENSKNIDYLLEEGHDFLDKHQLSAEYLEIRNENNLEIIHQLKADTPARIFIAVKIGQTRLIDNIPLIPRMECIQ